ncbi:MAG TPA: hypothetical protein VKE24_13010 [Candidatus Acidoferrales bacterium]|nr:hypothetical protein [Candidatus Acidoferrales bacterium]
MELRASLPVNAGFWWSENSGAASSGSWIILLCTSGILNITQLVEQTTASHVGQKLRLVDGQTGRNRITSCLPTVRELIRFSVFCNVTIPRVVHDNIETPERVHGHLHSGFGRILICHVEGSGANLIAILRHQICKAARIAGRCDEVIARCEDSFSDVAAQTAGDLIRLTH